jgi:hypothetical protein
MVISEEVNGNSDSIIVNADTATRKTMFEPAFLGGGGSKTLLKKRRNKIASQERGQAATQMA